MDVPFIFWIILATIFSALPILLVKAYIDNKNLYWIAFAIIASIILIIPYIKIVRQHNVTTIYSLIMILSIILIIIVDVSLFKEHLTITNIIGIILGMIAIYLLF